MEIIQVCWTLGASKSYVTVALEDPRLKINPPIFTLFHINKMKPLSERINHKKKRSEMFPHIQGGVSTTSEDRGKSPGETEAPLIRVFAPSMVISFAKLLIGLWPQESHRREILAMWWGEVT